MALPPQQFCVRWNSYHTNLQTVFPKLLSTENFVDVTLACENRQIKCHKVVLSACSTYFERLLIQNPCKHPIIFMKDMRFSEMQSLVDFMYKGEVNVSQDDLPSLLKSAEALQIRGLCGNDGNGNGNDSHEASTPQESRSNHKDSTPQNVSESPKDSLKSSSLNDSSSHNSTNESTLNNSSAQMPKKRKDQGTSPELQTEYRGSRKNGDLPLKEEMVEEDGLFYGEMENDEECGDQVDEEMMPNSGSGGQHTSDFAISNVTCEYDTSSSPPPLTDITPNVVTNDDHNYNAHNLIVVDQCEPPAFIIKQELPRNIIATNNHQAHLNQQLLEMSRKLLAAGNSAQLSQNAMLRPVQQNQCSDPCYTKRIRRSEDLLKKAADCVSRGQTFQTVSDQFKIPISTIRFFMARKGILPRRKRGRTSIAPFGNEASQISQSQQNQQQGTQPPSPTQPPYHMAHFKLPDLDLGKVS